MPRRQIFEEGQYYHIYNRGNNRGAIFFKPENYIFFLQRWKKYTTPYLDTIAYTLMPTHYHFLARVKNPGFFKKPGFSEPTVAISNAMQRFGLSYTRAINKRFDRVGSLFQGVYQAKLIQTESHLLHLCRYIHGNPVKDGLVADPADWEYSNYLEWLGERDGTLFDAEFVRAYFESPEDYRQFVLDDLLGRNLPDDIQLYLESLDN
jgi:putative transposase